MSARGTKEAVVASADKTFRTKEALQSLPATREQKSTLSHLQLAVSQKIEKIETASNTTVNITDLDFGPADAGVKPTVSKDSPTVSKKFKEEENREQPLQNTEKITKDRQKELDEQIKDIKDLETEIEEKKRLIMKTQEELEVKNIKITEFERREKERADEITKIKEAHSNEKAKLNGEIKSRQDIVTRLEKNLENLNWENTTLQAKTAEAEKKIKENERQYNKAIEKLYKENKAKIDALLEHHAQEIAGKNRQLNELALERDDMRNRFSKLAGDKLTNQNADIADLSDPNRAMKLSEKFGQLYDDEWTDAFEVLKGKKMLVKDAIQFLLDILQRCVAFCAKLRDTQMDSLKNVLLHPSQDVSMFLSEPRKHGQKDRPRMSSKDEKATLALRRQICMQENILDEVKQVFVKETKSSDKTGYNKKHLELCTPYLLKCAEICWSMVIHDPPLYIKFDAKAGDKLDLNFYTVYASTGEKIDFLVWPPLFNEEKGGLLSKGVAEPLKIIKK